MSSKILNKNRVLGIAVLIITAFFAYHTAGLPESYVEGDPGAKLFPYIGCAILAIFGIGMLFKCDEQTAPFLTKTELKRLLKLFSLYVLFFVLLWLFGYLVAIPLATFLISKLFSKEAEISNKKILIYTVLVTVGIYIAYVIALDSPLPKGLIWKLF